MSEKIVLLKLKGVKMKPDGNEVELNKEVSDTIDYYNRELKENGDDGHLEWTHDKRKKVVQLFYVYNL